MFLQTTVYILKNQMAKRFDINTYKLKQFLHSLSRDLEKTTKKHSIPKENYW